MHGVRNVITSLHTNLALDDEINRRRSNKIVVVEEAATHEAFIVARKIVACFEFVLFASWFYIYITYELFLY
jgi:hypothetical protein